MIAIAALIGNATVSAITPFIPSEIAGPTHEWEKSVNGTWAGANKVWYRLNTEQATLWSSPDGEKWDQVTDGKWQDNAGRWLKIDNKMLVWSADNGATWSEVPEWSWEGTDGTWNKFDKDWNLMVLIHNHQ